MIPGGGYFLWLDLAEGTDTPGAPGRGQGRRRPLRRRPRLHARRRRGEPAPLLRQRSPGADRRGGRAHRRARWSGSGRRPPPSDPGSWEPRITSCLPRLQRARLPWGHEPKEEQTGPGERRAPARRPRGRDPRPRGLDPAQPSAGASGPRTTTSTAACARSAATLGRRGLSERAGAGTGPIGLCPGAAAAAIAGSPGTCGRTAASWDSREARRARAEPAPDGRAQKEPPEICRSRR